MEQAHFGAKEIAHLAHALEANHVTHQQGSDDRLAFANRCNGDLRGTTGEIPNVLDSLAFQGDFDGWILGSQVIALHRLCVQIACDDLALGIQDRDDVQTTTFIFLLAVDELTLRKRRLAACGLIKLVGDRCDRTAACVVTGQTCEVDPFKAAQLLVLTGSAQRRLFDLCNPRGLEARRDGRRDKQGRQKNCDGGQTPNQETLHASRSSGRCGRRAGGDSLGELRLKDDLSSASFYRTALSGPLRPGVKRYQELPCQGLRNTPKRERSIGMISRIVQKS